MVKQCQKVSSSTGKNEIENIKLYNIKYKCSIVSYPQRNKEKKKIGFFFHNLCDLQLKGKFLSNVTFSPSQMSVCSKLHDILQLFPNICVS